VSPSFFVRRLGGRAKRAAPPYPLPRCPFVRPRIIAARTPPRQSGSPADVSRGAPRAVWHGQPKAAVRLVEGARSQDAGGASHGRLRLAVPHGCRHRRHTHGWASQPWHTAFPTSPGGGPGGPPPGSQLPISGWRPSRAATIARRATDHGGGPGGPPPGSELPISGWRPSRAATIARRAADQVVAQEGHHPGMNYPVPGPSACCPPF
jgi:hypothetical protein